ncbi:hypothetical protein [Kitasatospora sp. McL0602]|uniref:hypothetical protein n=1 Tax=Kitasatospora sp. McL0602 TaxID=3439530 RepID=UPI003F8CDF01
MTDPAGTTYAYSYSATGHLLETVLTNYTGSPTNPVSARRVVLDSRAYDPAGRLATDTDAMGRTTHTYYNDDNTAAELDLDGFHNPDGTTRNLVLQTNTYDPAGHLTQRVTGGGQTTVANTYDAASRPVSTTLDPGGLNRTSTNTSFDAAGDVLSVIRTGGTASAQTDYNYDAAGDVIRTTVTSQPADSVTTTTYDQQGLPVASISPNGNATGVADKSPFTSTQSYDALGRPTVRTGPLLSAESYDTTVRKTALLSMRPIVSTGYDTFGERTSTQDPQGHITTATYDQVGHQVAKSRRRRQVAPSPGRQVVQR